MIFVKPPVAFSLLGPALCSQTPSVCVLPLGWTTEFL